MMNVSAVAHVQTPAPSMQSQKEMANSSSIPMNASIVEHAKMVAPLAQSWKHNYTKSKRKSDLI